MNSISIEIPESMSMRKVAFFFLLLFIFSSFVDLRFSAGGKGLLTLSNFELCGYIMMLALVASACMQSFPSGAIAALSQGVHRWLILYLIWGILGAFLARGEVGKSMLIDLKMILPSIIGYFSIILIMTNDKKAKSVITAWTCAGMVNVILALSQFFLGGPHPVKPGQIALEKLDIGGDITRSLVTGFFGHPNSFSQIIIPYFVVFSTVWLLSDKIFSIKSLKLLLLGVLFGIVLILTSAKGAVLWSCIAIVLGVVMSRWKKLRTLSVFVSTWLICVAGINSLALLLVFNIVEYDSLRTLFSRIQFTIASINIFIDHPLNALIGGGMRFWPEYSSIWATWDYPNAHNVYLNQTLLFGVIGISMLVIFILTHIKYGLTCSKRNKDPLLTPLPYLAAVFALTGSYFFEPSFADPIQKFQLLFVLVMGFVFLKINSAESASLFENSTNAGNV